MQQPMRITLKEASLLVASALLTLAGALGLIRWLAPGLLGVPVDLRLVRASEKVPPFYEHVFSMEDVRSRTFLIPDPYLARAKPLLDDLGSVGPNDILGFRNRAVPARAAVVTIGDSQTYGNNAPLELNWPSELRRRLGLPSGALYNMGTGSWSALAYLYMAQKAHMLRPQLIVVAFYAGNDPLEAFLRAYGNPKWAAFRVDAELTAADAPDVVTPPPADEIWHAALGDGSAMAFTPTLRLSNQADHPAVDAGWEIMARAAEEISSLCERSGTGLLFTLLPTKETAIRAHIEAAGLQPPPAYQELVAAEQARTADFAARLRALPHGHYVDVIDPLQQAAAAGAHIYPTQQDGHPLAAGYRLIAERLAEAVGQENLRAPLGAYVVRSSSKNNFGKLRLVTRRGWWIFQDLHTFRGNGWRLPATNRNGTHVARVTDGAPFAHLPYLGLIHHSEPTRFGPESVRRDLQGSALLGTPQNP
jgi:lysophospholipase L1-like esterase